MRYYQVYIISQKLVSLYTYQSKEIIEKYTIVEVLFRNREKQAIVIDVVEKPEFKCNDIQDITTLYLPSRIYNIVVFIAQYYVCTISQALSIFYFYDKSFVDYKIDDILFDKKVELSDIQNEALNFCMSHPYSLLFGDTGSGKTEIYIQAIIDTLSKNKTAILLMPEISLSPQMEKRLKIYFDDYIAIWHSKLTPKKRKDILERIRQKKIRIIAGARSALFLPLDNLGLIIVDEEHDDAYKAMNAPMYNAKDMAVYFAKVLKIPIILGSATPSLTSYKKYPFFRLKGGYFSADKQFAFVKDSIDEGEFIINEIKQNFQENKQTIVFVPTKANFQYLICKGCSEVVLCPYCSISLSLYISKNALICHYCNYIQRIPTHCPSCNTGELHSKNIGTSEVVKILQTKIKDANIAQFDKNEITTDNKLRKILKEFNDKQIDILVGTQMIAKGHDYHNVSLAVIINIDSILNIQDYRSREKSLSMFLQISGRAGRKDNAKVIVQTYNEDFFSQYKDNYQDFLDEELMYREDLYPPCKKIARISFSDKNMDKAKIQMQKMQQLLSNVDDIEIVGFGQSPIFKIASKYRYYIFLRANVISLLLKSIYKCKNSDAIVDIDPVNFI
jgi:primosomal protein N' (replication factor Y)